MFYLFVVVDVIVVVAAFSVALAISMPIANGFLQFVVAATSPSATLLLITLAFSSTASFALFLLHSSYARFLLYNNFKMPIKKTFKQ